MSGVVRELKVRGKRFLSTYIRSKFPVFVDQAFASSLFREKLEHSVLPAVGSRLVALIDQHKTDILDKLRIDYRVAKAVDGMEVEEFHCMMKEFMDENFCAVQVLGFIFGIGIAFLLAWPLLVPFAFALGLVFALILWLMRRPPDAAVVNTGSSRG